VSEKRTATFSVVELEGRTARLRERLVGAGLDAMIATSYPNAYYLSGAPIHPFGRPVAVVVPAESRPAMVISVIELEHVRTQTWIDDVRPYWDYNPSPELADPRPPFGSLLRHLADILSERGLDRARLGFEDATLPDRRARELREAFPAAMFVPASAIVDRLRLVLSAEELAILRDADAVADVGQQAILDTIRVGVSAGELHHVAYDAMHAAARARRPDAGLAIRVTPGPGHPARSAGHSEWMSWGTDDVVRNGDILVSVLDCILWGYTGNVERTVIIGEPSPTVRRDAGTMVEANERAIAAVRPGVPVCEIDAICKEVFAAAGHATRTGSGVGRGLISYEGDHRVLDLDLRPYNDLVLESQMAFSIEPDLQTPDGTYRHCNTIIVTDDGSEVDSRIQRGVIVR
jgi:Xaa-Pro aminopeptidase